MNIRRSEERGFADHGWLKSYHSFSFADYYDPRHMHFRTLRVINEDYIQGGAGFPTHPHRDMEIITYVISGSLEHKDSTGTNSVIRPGEIQRMSAGTGIRHSEFNHEKDLETHLLQIWILPEQNGLEPGYEQKKFDVLEKPGLHLVATGNGEGDSISLNQDIRLYVGRLSPKQSLQHQPRKGSGSWLQLIEGEVTVGRERIQRGDAISTEESEPLTIADQGKGSHFLLFDLA